MSDTAMRTTGCPAFSSAATLASCAGSGAVSRPKVGEDAVIIGIAINLRRAQRFAIDRDDAFAELAGGFGDQLLEPRAQVGNSGRSDERNFVAAKFCGRAHDQAEHHSRILFHGNGRLAGFDHFFRALEELAGVEAHGRGGNHAEVRERRVASADGRQAIENVAEAVALGDLLHLRAGVGDRDKVAARLVFCCQLPRVCCTRSKKYCL